MRVSKSCCRDRYPEASRSSRTDRRGSPALPASVGQIARSSERAASDESDAQPRGPGVEDGLDDEGVNIFRFFQVPAGLRAPGSAFDHLGEEDHLDGEDRSPGGQAGNGGVQEPLRIGLTGPRTRHCALANAVRTPLACRGSQPSRAQAFPPSMIRSSTSLISRLTPSQQSSRTTRRPGCARHRTGARRRPIPSPSRPRSARSQRSNWSITTSNRLPRGSTRPSAGRDE